MFVIKGGYPLRGTAELSGAKNSALCSIAGAALGCGPTRLENVPDCTDTRNLCAILESLGARASFQGDGALVVDGSGLSSSEAPYEPFRRLRASFYVAGVLLARLGSAVVPFPGGDAIGTRGIDFHLKGFCAMGAEVSIEHGYVKINASRLAGTEFYVGRSSFGTTVNLMLASSLARGTTVLENAARDPEIVDLAILLNGMGAKVRGAGTPTIRIEGVKELSPTVHEIIPDRIEAGTLAVAAAMTGGDVVIRGVVPEHIRATVIKLEEAGARIETDADGEGQSNLMRVVGVERPRPVNIETTPYPGFPTDVQPQFVSFMARCQGMCSVRETIHENRFGYADELRRMGAELDADRDTMIVRGVERLTGAPVESPRDIRGGAALVLAGLVAEGTTEVRGVEDVDRGYDRLDEKLGRLGARIQRVRVTY